MKNRDGLLIVLSGPSGCGKGTVIRELMQDHPTLFYSVSATTRQPRPGEENGVDYHFLTTERFEELIASDGMLEHANYCGNYYGTPRAAVEEQCKAGKDVILEIEVQGAMQIRQKCPDAVFLFILPPSMEELARRLTDRQTEDMQTVQKRLAKAKDEMALAGNYDYIVVNDVVSETAAQIDAILTAEKFSRKRMQPVLDEILD